MPAAPHPLSPCCNAPILWNRAQLDRKLKEIILARKLEQAYSKKQILEMYANEVYFGHGRYGVEESARFLDGRRSSLVLSRGRAGPRVLAGSDPAGAHPGRDGARDRDRGG